MSGTMLFYVGVLVPAIITVILFIVFLYCLYRMRVRRKIMTKRYAPHSKGWPGHKDMTPPPLPIHPPPSTSSQLWEMRVIPAYDTENMQTLEQGSPRVVFETRLDRCTELDNVADLSSRRQDSGISELSDIQTRRGKRPYSQASSDSDDSGFRSSRSAHYLQKCDQNLASFQDVPLLRTLNRSSYKGEERDRSPISFTENIQITDYLAPTNVIFHPFYGEATDLPQTDIGHVTQSPRIYGHSDIPMTDCNRMASSGVLQLGGQTMTTTTAMVHNLYEDPDQQVYSVV